jgi:hypothetical protein
MAFDQCESTLVNSSAEKCSTIAFPFWLSPV